MPDEGTPETLRQRLINANLPCTVRRMEDGYNSVFMHSAEQAADAALAVFRDWLREQATADLMAAETTEFHWLQIDAEQCSCGEWREDETGLIHDRHVARAGLTFLADAIDKEPAVDHD